MRLGWIPAFAGMTEEEECAEEEMSNAPQELRVASGRRLAYHGGSMLRLAPAAALLFALGCARSEWPDGQRAYFLRDVVPVFTRHGCNSAQCHGGPTAPGHFRLSLFGGEPGLDHESVTRAASGRRLDRLAPAKSLLLEKATGGLSHGGGRTLRTRDRGYAAILAWLQQGATLGDEPRLVSLTVTPPDKTVAPRASVRLSALATFSDGTRKDVTAEASYRVSDPRVATVTGSGEVHLQGFGEAVVVASFQHQSQAVRLLAPRPVTAAYPRLPVRNPIDTLVFAKLRRLGLPPAPLCSDEVFLRRVHLDLIGTLPTPDEVRAFARDRSPNKRGTLIERLLGREEFIDHWALKWGDLLRIKSEFPVRVWPKGTQTYYRWVRQSIAQNKPYDRFVRELLLATGSNFRDGAANFFRANASKDPQSLAETTALLFMGTSLGCARCHGHPTEPWTLDDNLGLGAFFAKMAFKGTQEWKEEIVYVNRKGALHHPRTKELIRPRLLGGEALDLRPEQDPRGRFADWLTSPKNPYFTKMIVNRVWSWLMGRGIFHEPEELRPSNPASNPELATFLEGELIRVRYDLRALFRLIVGSTAYQLQSRAPVESRDDDRHFSRYYLRRLSAEQLLDAIGQVTETSEAFQSPIPEPFTLVPPGHRAIRLHDGDLTSPFLSLFGRASRDTPYESEQNRATSMRQSLHLLNSEHLHARIASSPRVARWLQTKKSDADIVEELYLAALSRLPSADEKAKLTAHLRTDPKRRADAVQDVVWTVLNSSEFLFNH